MAEEMRQPAAPDQQQEAVQSMKTVEDALLNLLEAVQEAGAPPEAIDALKTASDSYGKFLSIVTGAVPAGEEAPKQAPAEAAGAPGPVTQA
jgi:hypothetical protein